MATRSTIVARAAEAYVRLLGEVTGGVEEEMDETAGEKVPEAQKSERGERPGELTVQGLWGAGLLGADGETTQHRFVHIVEFGEWNHGAGPDFLRAEVEIDGKTYRGDIEIDPQAQDWERHGHGSNPHFNNVILHVVLSPPPPGWYTRTEQHTEVPVLYLRAEQVREAIRCTAQPVVRLTNPCQFPLAEMKMENVVNLLQSVAAYRVMGKRKRFRDKAATVGRRQAWYEAWAETLGYSENKEQMVMLARRAPVRSLRQDAEAMLLGVAGFLQPVVPAGADEEGKEYYRKLWEEWWKLQSFFGVEPGRAPNWRFTGVRPANHPQRRVAALAVSTQRWSAISPLLNAENITNLTRVLTGLRHEFWDRHCTISSAPLRRRVALVGQQRVHAFLSNYVLVDDASERAWEAYVRLPAGTLSRRVLNTARNLFGEREKDMAKLLKCEYVHQALLQIANDFCTQTACRDCLFPEQLRDWHKTLTIDD